MGSEGPPAKLARNGADGSGSNVQVPQGPPAAKLGIAVVGLGRAGTFHMNSLKALSDVAKLLWVVDVDRKRLQEVVERERCKGSTDLQDALQDTEVGAVVICSTTHTHFGYCKAALQAGKAVFTEKPISHKTEELREVVELAVSKGITFVVGYQRRVDRNFRDLQRRISAGAIGQLRLLKCCSRDNPLPPIEYLKVSGGIFYDMLTHDFDMIHFLSNQIPEEVYSTGHCYSEELREAGDLDMVVVTLRFASGLLAFVDCSRISPCGYDQRVEAFGELGMATAHNEACSTVVVGTADGFQHPRSEWSFPERYRETYTTELAEFVSLARAGGVEPEGVVRRHVELEQVTAAAELSWRLGRPVKLAEVPDLRHKLPH